MSKSIEELMKLRFKVIADYPQTNINPFHVGDILSENGIHFTRMENPKSIHGDDVIKYPHLFKPLAWWEERQPEEMPEYIVIVEGGRKGFISKVTYWAGYNALTTNEKHHQAIDVSTGKENGCEWQPATLEEYTSYINKSK